MKYFIKIYKKNEVIICEDLFNYDWEKYFTENKGNIDLIVIEKETNTNIPVLIMLDKNKYESNRIRCYPNNKNIFRPIDYDKEESIIIYGKPRTIKLNNEEEMIRKINKIKNSFYFDGQENEKRYNFRKR